MELSRLSIRDRVRNMSPTRYPIMENWDYYRGDLARTPYFPRLQGETDLEYKARVKIVVGWAGTIENRIASYFRKEPIEVSFKIRGVENDRSKEASDIWAETAENNSWAAFMVDIARDAGVGGEAFPKERISFYDPYTGAARTTGSGAHSWKGAIEINRVPQVYMYMIPDLYRTNYIEAWKRKDGQFDIISGTNPREENELEYIELIRPSWFDDISGDWVERSARVIWRNEDLVYGPAEIRYPSIPVHRFANLVSRPESESGISEVAPLKSMSMAINHVLSGMTRSVIYHGWPQIVFKNVDPSTVQRGVEYSIYLPESSGLKDPSVDVLSWDQNLQGAQALHTALADIMASISGVPKSMLHDLDGTGNVASGIALRIMYKNLNDLCAMKEGGFRKAEAALIRNCLDILAVENGQPNYWDGLEVSVSYCPDRTPRDMDAEFQEDLRKRQERVINLVDMVMKYVSGIETREDAVKYLEARAEEDKKLRGLFTGGEGEMTPLEKLERARRQASIAGGAEEITDDENDEETEE